MRTKLQMFRIAGAVAGLCMLTACAGDPTTGASGAASGELAQYATHTDQFAELQTSGLRGDYPGFARALKVEDPAAIVALLNRSFGGKPFDVVTREANSDTSTHKRAIELRNTTGRMYLFVEMAKVPGGWVVSEHDLGRQRGPILARL